MIKQTKKYGCEIKFSKTYQNYMNELSDEQFEVLKTKMFDNFKISEFTKENVKFNPIIIEVGVAKILETLIKNFIFRTIVDIFDEETEVK